MKSVVFSVLNLDSRCTIQHRSTKKILLLHAQEFTLHGPLKKSWLCRCLLGSGWSSLPRVRKHGLTHQHTQVRAGLSLEDFRALPPPQTWQRRGRARGSLVAGVQLHPGPWLEPGCPGAGGLSSVAVSPVLIWCPQHGLLSGTGEGPEPSGGGRTAEGPQVPVLSKGWSGHTPGRPEPAATPGSSPSHGRSWGPRCWVPVRRHLDTPGHLTADHSPPQPYCSGPQTPLESLSALPWLAAPLTSSAPVSTFPSLPLFSRPLFPSLPSSFPSHLGQVEPFYR